MDSLYASPDDFKRMTERDKIRGLHLLEFFVERCNQIGVLESLIYFSRVLLSLPIKKRNFLSLRNLYLNFLIASL